MSLSYEELKKKLSKQMQKNRDSLVREKVHLFYLALKLRNVSEACERRNVSRDFYYRWWSRFKGSNFKLESLNERSRRPKTSPKRISKNLERKILHLGLLGHGAMQIEMVLRQRGISVHQSTIGLVLRRRKRKNPLSPKWKKKKSHSKRYEVPVPGWRIQIDVKYGPKIFGSPGNYVYVAIDECTRWRFAKAYPSLNQYMTEDFLNELKTNCPFPIRCIQSDNGPEFSFKLFGRGPQNHRMAHWCKENQIIHRLIPPGEKELNGKVERSHRIDQDYFYWRAKPKSMKIFNLDLKKWIRFYNHQRPHGGLNGLTPIQKLEERKSVLPWMILEEYWQTWQKRFCQSLQNQKINLYTQLQKELLIYNYYWAEVHPTNPLSGISPGTTGELYPIKFFFKFLNLFKNLCPCGNFAKKHFLHGLIILFHRFIHSVVRTHSQSTFLCQIVLRGSGTKK